MPQYNWTYVGGGGKNFKVSLFHGRKTGHVLLLLDGHILQIDFSVRDSKTYAFFIEDEFCEVHLERKGEEMYYFFEINKKVDTPRNRERRKRDRKYLGQSLAFFGLLVVLATLASLAFLAYDKKLDQKRMQAGAFSDSTKAWVQLDTLSNSSSIRYFYVVGADTYSQFYFIDRDSPAPDFPLETGDEFLVRFHPARPDLGRIYLSQPSPAQIRKYIEKVAALHLSLHPEEHPPYVRCTLEQAFERSGLSGLADFYYQNEPPEANPDHNHNSYLRLVRDPEFQQILATRCWN